MNHFGVFRILKGGDLAKKRRSIWPTLIGSASIIVVSFTVGFNCGKQDLHEVHIGFNAKTCVLDMGGAIVDSSASSLFTTWLANHRCT